MKKGYKGKPMNKMLMRLTLMIGKLLEGIWRQDLLHLAKYGLIRDSQHGFMHGISSNFVGMTKRINKGCILQVCIDLSNAFHKVQHGSLVCKVLSNAVQGRLTIWI